jgi:hypothetical protein
MFKLSRRSLLIGSAAASLSFPLAGAKLAHVEKAGAGYRELPVPWNPAI